MPIDLLRYDILVQDALRGMVRDILVAAARKGLPGDHHFFITFDTTAEGVRLSERLRERYPEEMTIVLQHQFWDLKVTDEGFEVGLSFSGVPERLVVPFAAVSGFADPSVQFALQFETLEVAPEETADRVDTETTPDIDSGKAREPSKREPRSPARQRRARPSIPAAPTPDGAPAAAGAQTPQGKPRQPSEEASNEQDDKPGAEVVRLDRFRKK